MDVPSTSSTEGSGTSRQQRGGEVEELQRKKCSALPIGSAAKCDYHIKVVLYPDTLGSTINNAGSGSLGDNARESTRYVWNMDNITSSTDTEIESTEKWYIVSSTLLKANSLYLYECSIDPRWRTEGDVATIHIRSSEEPAFKKLLEFIHGCYAPGTSSNVSELSQVMVVAKRFRVSTCYDICEALLIRNYGSLEHPELLTLPQSVVLQLLQSNDLEVDSEDVVYRFATEWGRKNHSTIRRRRHGTRLEIEILVEWLGKPFDEVTWEFETDILERFPDFLP